MCKKFLTRMMSALILIGYQLFAFTVTSLPPALWAAGSPQYLVPPPAGSTPGTSYRQPVDVQAVPTGSVIIQVVTPAPTNTPVYFGPTTIGPASGITLATSGMTSAWFYESCKGVTAGGLKAYGIPNPAITSTAYGPLPLFQVDGQQAQRAGSGTSRTWRGFSCGGWDNILLRNGDAVSSVVAAGGATNGMFPGINSNNGIMYAIPSASVTGPQGDGSEFDTSTNGASYYSMEVDDLSSGSSWVCQLIGSDSGTVGLGGVTILQADAGVTPSMAVTCSSVPVGVGYVWVNVSLLSGGPIHITVRGAP